MAEVFVPNRIVHRRLASGEVLTIRPFRTTDAASLAAYFRSLAQQSHYNRFLGASNSPSASDLVATLDQPGGLVTSVAEIKSGQSCRLVGEARHAVGPAGVEFALSVADDWHGRGIGSALLAYLERKAATGNAGLMYGDTLRSNDAMQALARKRDYALTHPPGDWTLVRFQKPVNASQADVSGLASGMAHKSHPQDNMQVTVM